MISEHRVLLIGRDQLLMQTRALMLGTFFQVASATRLSEAVAQLDGHAFDLVILCHSLSDDEYSQVAAAIQRLDPQPRVLTLQMEAKANIRNGLGHSLSSAEGPYALLKKAAEILEFDIKSKRGNAAGRNSTVETAAGGSPNL